jgi:hypothetical protein
MTEACGRYIGMSGMSLWWKDEKECLSALDFSLNGMEKMYLLKKWYFIGL